MGKNKSVFVYTFKKTRYFDIENVNFDPVLKSGTCLLKSKRKCYNMIWTLNDYPTELPNMPGAPYPVLCTYTIFDKHNCFHSSAESMSGEFVYQVNSGTPPPNNTLGLPYGKYPSLAEDNNCHKHYNVRLLLVNDCMEVSIRNKC